MPLYNKGGGGVIDKKNYAHIFTGYEDTSFPTLLHLVSLPGGRLGVKWGWRHK